MHRYLVADNRKLEEWKIIAQTSNLQIITPSKAIAANLKVPHCSLESLAQTIIRKQGWRIASALLSLRILGMITNAAKFYLPTIRELLRSKVDLVTLQQDKFDRVKELASLALQYREILRHEYYLDSAELLWQAAQANETSRGYLFYGYFLVRSDELAFMEAIADENSILISPYRRLAESSLPCPLAPSSPNTLQTYPNLIAEVRGILQQIAWLLHQKVTAKNIVLIAREERLYGEALIDIAWEYGIPVRVLYEIPVAETRLGGWLQLLLEVIKTNFPFETTAKLLAHPLARYISPEIWQEARKIHPQSVKAWQELGVDLSLLKFPSGKYDRSVWVRRLQNILEQWQILENGKTWAREIVAYYRLRDTLNESAQTTQDKIDRTTFIAEIEEILVNLTVPAQPGRGGIELHAPTAVFGTSYQYVFVLGMAEGIFPLAIADDPVLDFYARSRLAQNGFLLETAAEKAQKERSSFEYLLEIATTAINFSYPQTIDNKPVLPSPYLTQLGLKPTKIDNLPLASIETARCYYLHHPEKLKDPLMPQIIKAWQVETYRESGNPPDEYDGVIGKGINPDERIFSASQLTQLGQCPFKWFSSRLLKLKELLEAEADLNVTFRGNLYHRCLELSLAEIKTASDLANLTLEQLAQAFATAETELELIQLPGWDRQRQEHLELLYRNTISPEFLPNNREIIDREREFSTQWHGLQIKGKIDRLDRSDKELTVIDYKTSSTPPAGIKDDTGKANIDLQLTLYTESMAAAHPEDTVTAVYYSLTKRTTMRRSPSDPQALAAFAQRVKSHLTTGNYPVAPDNELQACRYCSFDLVCRKGDRLSRKCCDR
jgi:RecB family exonuclease